MHTYNLVLFIHIIAAIVLFAATAVRLASIIAASRSESAGTIRALATMALVSDRAMPVAGLALVGTGAYLVDDLWVWRTAWIEVAFAATLPMFVVGPAVPGRLLTRLHGAAKGAPDGTAGAELKRLAGDPALLIAEGSLTGVLFGVVYLMATKPGMQESVTAVVAGGLCGAVLATLLVAGNRWAGSAAAPAAAAEG